MSYNNYLYDIKKKDLILVIVLKQIFIYYKKFKNIVF